MSNPTTHANYPTLGLHETFDRVHDDGAVIIDPAQCALALFVTRDGHVQLQSPMTAEQVADALRKIVHRMEAKQHAVGRLDPEDTAEEVPSVQVLADLLSLVDAELPGPPFSEGEVAGWTDEQRTWVAEWASAVHLAASDNDVTIPTVPAVLVDDRPMVEHRIRRTRTVHHVQDYLLELPAKYDLDEWLTNDFTGLDERLMTEGSLIHSEVAHAGDEIDLRVVQSTVLWGRG